MMSSITGFETGPLATLRRMQLCYPHMNAELHHYDEPTGRDGGLLSLYRRAGLQVVHFPADDPAHDLTARDAFEPGLEALTENVAQSLPNLEAPTVIHCSAAIDPSPPLAARLAFLYETGQL
jgi:hypothetical protein